MGKMKSLKWSLCIYFPICFILSFAGSMLIGFATNDLQDWYEKRHSDVRLWGTPEDSYTISSDGDIVIGKLYIIIDDRPVAEKKNRVIYFIISYAQFLLIPLWIIFCVVLMGMIFYKRELQKPINILLDASHKISENQLDFRIEYNKSNEIGQLCTAFDEMRLALYNNNLEMWKSIEERKRVNSAFSHDLRIPLTVLHGYADFLQQYVPDGKVSQEKLIDVLSMMSGQITRLEHYTARMNAVQKLEDIIPNTQEIFVEELRQNILQTGKFLCKDKKFELVISVPDDIKTLEADPDIVMQVCENIMSNAVRYAENHVTVFVGVLDSLLSVSVYDDGKGFSDEALEKADSPFFRDEKEEDKTHFGLGLYICRLLCEKCRGHLYISNGIKGGKVTAEFSCIKNSDNR